MYKKYYQHFLDAHKGSIHLAAHSHHFWPDITRQALLKSWDDAAKFSDKKWAHIFTNILPKTQFLISKIINFSRPNDIAFAPNTHELLSRLLSCFLEKDNLNILTTQNEFHSFSRQLNRLSEISKVKILKLDNEDKSFKENFIESITPETNFIFLSHVFYNTGDVLDLNFIKEIISKKNKDTVLCLDAYHGFCAIPTDISEIEDDIFYIAGGYKYAQAGEGCCFMTLPKDCQLRPVNTGWFASFETLDTPSDIVSYSNNGFRFWGSTLDLSSLYKFNSVWELFSDIGLDIEQIHKYIQSLQTYFLKELASELNFLNTDLSHQGHFLTIEFNSGHELQSFYNQLVSKGLLVDFRGLRLRFGFGPYLDQDDIEKAISKIKQISL